jgi:hypothetical protein
VARRKQMVHVAEREVKEVDPGTIEQHILRWDACFCKIYHTVGIPF